MTLLSVDNLRTEFRTRAGALRAVDGVSFEVSPGETLGLVGESGSGKSVTALSIMRLVPGPDGAVKSGSVFFDGVNLLDLPEEAMRQVRGASLAMVFQDPMTSLNPVLTIGRQLTEVLQLHLQLGKRAARRRAIELLNMVGIPAASERLNNYPHQFSGGMRQRVMIAMALSCGPKLVLADEITTALDVTIQAQILELLRELARDSNTAFILITHDLGIVARMTQRVHVMYAGQIVEKASTADLFANPRMPYTWGLLGSIPRLDAVRQQRLVPIEGMPPDLVQPRLGCRFQPRCRYRRDICSEQEPPLARPAQTEEDHEARCWGTQDVPNGGWLIGVDWRRASAGQDLGGAVVRESSAPSAREGDVSPAVRASE